MKLCLAHGVEHPDYLQLTAEQFQDWVAYHDVEPWGESRADQREAAFTVWRNSSAKWDAENVTMPEWRYPYFEPAEQQNIRERLAVLKARAEEIRKKSSGN